MGWKFKNESEEFQAVKAVLEPSYPGVRVGPHREYGKRWLKISLELSRPDSCFCTPELGGMCWDCIDLVRSNDDKIVKIVQEVTGRKGEWGGCIDVLIHLIPNGHQVV